MVMAPSMAITISHPPPLYTQRGGEDCRGAPCVLFQENVLLKPWLYGAVGLTIDQIHTQTCKKQCLSLTKYTAAAGAHTSVSAGLSRNCVLIIA